MARFARVSIWKDFDPSSVATPSVAFPRRMILTFSRSSPCSTSKFIGRENWISTKGSSFSPGSYAISTIGALRKLGSERISRSGPVPRSSIPRSIGSTRILSNFPLPVGECRRYRTGKSNRSSRSQPVNVVSISINRSDRDVLPRALAGLDIEIATPVPIASMIRTPKSLRRNEPFLDPHSTIKSHSFPTRPGAPV